MVSYLSKVADFNLHHLHLAPPVGVIPGLAILVEHRLVTDTETDEHRTMAYTTVAQCHMLKMLKDRINSVCKRILAENTTDLLLTRYPSPSPSITVPSSDKISATIPKNGNVYNSTHAEA